MTLYYVASYMWYSLKFCGTRSLQQFLKRIFLFIHPWSQILKAKPLNNKMFMISYIFMNQLNFAHKFCGNFVHIKSKYTVAVEWGIGGRKGGIMYLQPHLILHSRVGRYQEYIFLRYTLVINTSVWLKYGLYNLEFCKNMHTNNWRAGMLT